MLLSSSRDPSRCVYRNGNVNAGTRLFGEFERAETAALKPEGRVFDLIEMTCLRYYFGEVSSLCYEAKEFSDDRI